jgi:predicted TIM-barrel fold metal-dependent hydrolase
LKVYKSFNLLKDTTGKFVPLDDSRYAPIWDKAGDLGIPVLMHSADPSQFWTTVDRFNERYEELKDFPEWSFNDPQLPKKETLLSQTENLVKRHPKTIFVMAHMGSNSENLQYVDYLMNKYPNYYVDIAAVIAELGRQPYTARMFFIKYQDRIVFGTDGGYGLDKMVVAA